jgi:uncharacterized membrane protein YhaH (DUF805 family)
MHQAKEKNKIILWAVGNLLFQTLLRATITALSIVYAKGKVKDLTFLAVSLFLNLISAFVFLYINYDRKKSTSNVEKAIEKLKSLCDKNAVNDTKVDKKEKVYFFLEIISQIIFVISTVLVPFLYKKDYISEVPYYFLLFVSVLFGAVPSLAMTYDRLQSSDKTSELLALVNSIESIQFKSNNLIA